MALYIENKSRDAIENFIKIFDNTEQFHMIIIIKINTKMIYFNNYYHMKNK